MEVRLLGRTIEIREVHMKKVFLPMEVTPSGIITWPFASGVIRHSAATPPRAISSSTMGSMRAARKAVISTTTDVLLAENSRIRNGTAVVARSFSIVDSTTLKPTLPAAPVTQLPGSP